MELGRLFSSTLYDSEIVGLRKLGYTLMITKKATLRRMEKTLIAYKKIGDTKVEVYLTALPAHFAEIRVPIEGLNKTAVFGTGSGSIEEYLEKLEPILPRVINDMISVHMEENLHGNKV